MTPLRLAAVVGAVGLLAGFGLGSLAAGVAAPALPFAPAAVAEPGTEIRFHLDAYDAAGALLFTTRPRDAGHLPRLENLSFSGPREGRFESGSASDGAVPPALFNVGPYLRGHKAGHVAWTPFITQPFGPKEPERLPLRIGPLAPVAELDLAWMYGPEQSARTAALYGPREAIVPGASLRYEGVIPATVQAVADGVARLRLEVRGGEVVQSTVLGAPFEAIVEPDGSTYLRPLLEPGMTFTTQGCQLPGAVVPPGTYTVLGSGDGHWSLDQDLGDHEVLYTQPMRFRVELVAVEA